MPDLRESLRFLDEVASGDHRRVLEALRDRVALELDQVSGRAVPALAKVLLDIERDLAKLPVGRELSIEEELGRRRAAREAGVTARGESRAKRYGGREREEFPRQRGS